MSENENKEVDTGLKSTTGGDSMSKLAKDISMALVTKPAISMLEIFLPSYVTDEINEYLEELSLIHISEPTRPY